MRRHVSVAIGLVGLLAVTGCGLLGYVPGEPLSVESRQVDGFRSDPDHRGLLASYLGGACDGPARLVLTESNTRVEARVAVEQKPGSCIGVGIPRSVKARLAQPLGERNVWSGGREHVPFDGARLLAPSVLPAGFDRLSEMGMSTDLAASPGVPVVTTTWVVVRSASADGATSDTCPASWGPIEVRIGPASDDRFREEPKVDSVKIGSSTADVYRGGTSKKPDYWAYVWTVGRTTVAVSSETGCDGSRLLGRTELLRVARSLRPV